MISIIIPTYNESKNLPVLLERIDISMKNSGYKYECIVVDDDSPDNTYGIAKKLVSNYPLNVFLRKDEHGLSSAMLFGFEKAKGDIVGFIDADLQHPPEVIPELIKEIVNEDVNMVIGSRQVEGGRVEGWPFYRRLVSFVARLIVLPLTDVKDTMSGFFFIKPEIIKGVKLNTIGYKLGLEIIIKGNHQDKIKEVPYTFHHRLVGESKMNTKTYIEYVWQIVLLYLYKFGILR